MQCLKTLSRQGRKCYYKIFVTEKYIQLIYFVKIKGTIIFSIHQPRYSIFKIFDTVMFMCKGRCVYHDSAKNVVPFFATHGYQCETYDNPADYALDVLIDVSRNPEKLARLNNIYNSTHVIALTLSQSQRNLLNNENIEQERQKYKVEAARSVGSEIFYLAQRTFRNSIRNPALALSQTLVSIAIGLLVGLLFYDLKKTIEPGVQNRLGAIFFIVMSQTFSNMTAIETLISESVLFIHVYILFQELCQLLYFIYCRNVQVVTTEFSHISYRN